MGGFFFEFEAIRDAPRRLISMFHSGGASYPKQYVMTSWVDFRVKQVDIPDTSTAVELYLFDCAGDPVFNQVRDSVSVSEVF